MAKQLSPAGIMALKEALCSVYLRILAENGHRPSGKATGIPAGKKATIPEQFGQ